MWSISKEIHFCYGHRVYTQELNAEYSLDTSCKCKHLHGHNGLLIVACSSDQLEKGFVTDFKHLNWLKKFVDDYLDHKFIIGEDDPQFETIIPNLPNPHLISGVSPYPYCWKNVMIDDFETGARIMDPNYFKMLADDSLIEVLEGFVTVPFVPTSEELCTWFYKLASYKMGKIGINVDYITFKETDKTSCTYKFVESDYDKWDDDQT